MKRKLTIFILALALIMCMMPTCAFATVDIPSTLSSTLAITELNSYGIVSTDLSNYDGYGISEGVILSTGDGYNSATEDNEFNSTQDADLKQIVNASGNDVGGDTSVYEFKLTAPCDGTLAFNYIFGSDEFYYDTEFNDSFGLFISINGGAYENLAKLRNGKEVTINNLREACGVKPIDGEELDEEELMKSIFTEEEMSFIYGLIDKYGDSANPSTFTPTEQEKFFELEERLMQAMMEAEMSMDLELIYNDGTSVADNTNLGYFTYVGEGKGYTDILSCKKSVQKNDEIKIKFAICDATDQGVESYVIIEAHSLEIVPLEIDQDLAVNDFLKARNGCDEVQLYKKLGMASEQSSHPDEMVKIWIDSKEIPGSSVTETEKNLISAKLPAGYGIKAYMDITVWKKWDSDLEGTKIEVLPNGKIKIVIDVPEEIQKWGDSIKMVRVHDGEAVLINGTYYPGEGTFVFESDMYSTYALIYNETSPETGVNDYIVLISIMALSIASFGICALKRKNSTR